MPERTLQIKTWPVRFLLAGGTVECEAELRCRLLETPAPCLAEICRNHLANAVLIGQNDSGIPRQTRDALEAAAAVELGWVAKRKLALRELDAGFAGKSVTACLIKGACTSLLYYPQESMRWSNDIDLVLPKQDLWRLYPEEMQAIERRDYVFPRLHLSRKTVVGTAVEIHHRFGLCACWGTAEDIRVGMAPLKSCSNLGVPDPRVTATILLLHILKDRGRGAYDVLDWSFLMKAGVIDWRELMLFWREHDLVPYILPGLLLAGKVTENVPANVVTDLRHALSRHHQRLVHMFVDYLDAPRVTRLKTLRVRQTSPLTATCPPCL